MRLNAVKDCKFVRCKNAVAAGATAITDASGVDMAGFDSVCFIFEFGAIVAGAETGVKAQSSSDDGSTDTYADIAGTSVTVADDQDNKIAILDIHRPPERYVKPYVSRATQNATLEGITAILYNGNASPVTQGTTVMSASELHWSPAVGTA